MSNSLYTIESSCDGDKFVVTGLIHESGHLISFSYENDTLMCIDDTMRYPFTDLEGDVRTETFETIQEIVKIVEEL